MSKVTDLTVVDQPDFGKEISRHHQRVPLTWWALLFLSILGFLLTSYLLQGQVYDSALYHGQASALRTLTQIAWIPAGFLLVALISLVGLILYPRRSVSVTEGGLVIHQTRGDRYLKWSEITGIQLDFRRIWVLFFPVKRQQVRIQMYTRESYIFDGGLKGLENLKQEIEGRVYQHIYKRMRAGQELNAVLNFGPLLVYPLSGIKMNGMAIPWERISSIDLKSGFIELKYYAGASRQRLRARLGEIPNAPVLLKIVKEILDNRGN